ncbi:MAG: DUF6079 family protein [Thermodesulfovibrionales bacterium]
MKLRDIIELSDVRLVIELDDAERDPEGILNSFIITDEVERGLKAILHRIAHGKGCGAFIKGNFGSGKSHFLSFLYLLLRDKAHPLLKDYKGLQTKPFQLIKISLVRYPASLSLEGILLQCLNYKEKVIDREELFKNLFKEPTVIIIDELSEFLRSKPSSPQFYEDVRFLQFLGEFSMRHPLWVIASLQEWIEETGHISSSIFQRIKDRYPLRINLSSSHIEDIIDQRLIKKKEGSEGIIRSVFDELKRFYPHLELRFDRFKKTYPLHPFTTRFLSGLTRVFSQHRGVIQFVQSEVLKRLDEPADSLITPDAIFDHFIDRIREMPETSSLVRVVYEYYRNNLPSIFKNPVQREIAEAVIKLLILTELSPLEKRKTAKDIAEILLKKISTIRDSINYDYIRNGILEPLVAVQMYIMKEGDAYFVDVSQDEGIRLKARVKAFRERFSDRNYLFSEVANLISLPYLPLKEIKEARRYRFKWQNSLRECTVLSLTEVCKEHIDGFIDGVKKRVDCYLVLLSPFHTFTPLPQHLFNTSSYLSLIVFWQPRTLTEEEFLFIEEYIAKNMLINEFPSLKEELRRTDAFFRDTITKAYFEGKVFSAEGRELLNINEIGYLPIERLLSHLFDAPLKGLYPEHERIMPRIEIYSTHHITNLFNHFIKQGRLTIEEAEKKALVPYIKGLLEPLGLVIKRGSNYTLHITPENELISWILETCSHEHNLYNIKLQLKRSQWGLMDDQIDLILSSLISSGYLIPYGREGAIELKDISQLSSGEIINLRQGKAIEPELLMAIPKGRFIWGDIETVPTPITIKAMWKEASQFIRRYRKLIDELQSMINRYREYSIFKLLRIDTSLLNRISMFVHSIGLNISPEEGIERFLLFLKEEEDLQRDVSYLERLYKFFDEEFQLINKYYLYLTHPSLKIDGEIEHLRESILTEIQETLKELSQLDHLRREWTRFYELYTTSYKDSHDNYYRSSIFGLKQEVEGLQTARTLRKIAHLVSTVTFQMEWWEIKRIIEGLPERCNADLNQELFINPVCRCGFQIGMKPPVLEMDISRACEEGLRNFLKTLQSPENREKIDSTIMGLSLSEKKDLSQRLLHLLSIKADKANINQILSLLDEEVLQEIENAFKGRWKVKEVRLDDLIEKLKDRRFRYEDLRRLILDWIGEDRESIIHVIGLNKGGFIGEDLSIYGVEGKKAEIELRSRGVLEGEELNRVFDSINLRNFKTPELINLLEKEKNDYMKKRLRNELFERFLNSDHIEPRPDEVMDELLSEVLKAISLIRNYQRFKGIQVFVEIIAPLSKIIEGLLYKNINDKFFDQELLERLYNLYTSIIREYEERHDKYDGARDIEYVKERLEGNVVVMDGLRYDLWLIFKDIMLLEGWRIKEEVFRIDSPTTTPDFREALGIIDETGTINGRSYLLLRVAEKEIGKRNLRRFLKADAALKFLHFNFIDTRVHGSTIDLYPLYELIKKEFIAGILPILKEVGSFYLLSDHGFRDTKELKERYRHGGKGLWETLLPLAEIKI